MPPHADLCHLAVAIGLWLATAQSLTTWALAAREGGETTYHLTTDEAPCVGSAPPRYYMAS
jgi:hypothetical protein